MVLVSITKNKRSHNIQKENAKMINEACFITYIALCEIERARIGYKLFNRVFLFTFEIEMMSKRKKTLQSNISDEYRIKNTHCKIVIKFRSSVSL